MSQQFRKAAEYMGDQAELREHGVHLAIACNHLSVRLPLHDLHNHLAEVPHARPLASGVRKQSGLPSLQKQVLEKLFHERSSEASLVTLDT